MDPELLAAMQAYFLNGNAPALYPTGPAPNPYAPELDPFAQNLYATAPMPDVNSKGEMVPYGLDTQKSLTNYQQDINQVFADPVNAYMASLLGGEGFAPGVFDPIAKETPITLSQLPVMQQMIGAGGYQGTLAKLLMPKELGGQGMNPATAVRLLQNAINNPEAASQVAGIDPSEIEQIKADLPPLVDTSFGAPRVVEGQYDWQSISREAQDLWKPMAQEFQSINAPNVVSRDGQYFSTEQIDSPQTEFLKKLGIPNPNARYDLQYAMENDPSIAGLFQHAAQTDTQARNMRKTFEQYTKKVSKQREQDAKTRAEDARKYAEYEAMKSSMAPAFQPPLPGGGMLTPINPVPAVPTDVERPALSPFSRYADQGNLFQQQIGGIARQIADAAGAKDQPLRSGMTADEVSALFNKATEFLPKTFRPERRVLEAARRPLQRAALAANKASSQDQLAMFRSMIPFAALNAAGRTPAKDVVQQRLLPMYASGALGQQGLPGTYPNPAAVRAAFGG